MTTLEELLGLLEDKETKILILEKSIVKTKPLIGKESDKVEIATLQNKIPASQILGNTKQDLLTRNVDAFSFSGPFPTGGRVKSFLKE